MEWDDGGDDYGSGGGRSAMHNFQVASEAMIRKVFWVNWFHKAPHLNLTLHFVNSTFDPYSPVYQESLGIIGSVPAGILILTLLILLVYLLTRCCDNRPRKPGSIACLKVTCVLTALFTLGSLGVAVWGNEEIHNGVSDTLYSLKTINNRIGTLINKTRTFDQTIQRNLEPELNLFRGKVEKRNATNSSVHLFIIESLNYMRGNISEVLLFNVEDIRSKLLPANLTEFMKMIKVGEMIRWVATVAITGLLMMVVLVVPLGVIRHSRCTLITFSVLGLLSLILCWAMTSLYLVINVGLSDWCSRPDPFVENRVSRLISYDVATYYMRCDPTRPSPFTRYLTHAQQAADVLEVSLDKVTRATHDNYPEEKTYFGLRRLDTYVKQSQRTLGSIAALLECQNLKHQYLLVLSAMCYQTVSGFVYLLLSATGSGVFFTLLVWCTSHTWIYLNNKAEVPSWSERERLIGERRGPSHPVAHVGPPRPRHSHTPPQTPPFPGTLNGRMFHGDTNAAVAAGTLTSPSAPPPSIGAGGGGAAAGGPPSLNNTISRSGVNQYSLHAMGPNQGQYATLSKQCKTLESSDFY